MFNCFITHSSLVLICHWLQKSKFLRTQFDCVNLCVCVCVSPLPRHSFWFMCLRKCTRAMNRLTRLYWHCFKLLRGLKSSQVLRCFRSNESMQFHRWPWTSASEAFEVHETPQQHTMNDNSRRCREALLPLATNLHGKCYISFTPKQIIGLIK